MSKGSGSSPQIRERLNITLKETYKIEKTTVVRKIHKNMEVSQMIQKQVIHESSKTRVHLRFVKKTLIFLTAMFLVHGYRDGISSSTRNHLFYLI